MLLFVFHLFNLGLNAENKLSSQDEKYNISGCWRVHVVSLVVARDGQLMALSTIVCQNSLLCVDKVESVARQFGSI